MPHNGAPRKLDRSRRARPPTTCRFRARAPRTGLTLGVAQRDSRSEAAAGRGDPRAREMARARGHLRNAPRRCGMETLRDARGHGGRRGRAVNQGEGFGAGAIGHLGLGIG